MSGSGIDQLERPDKRKNREAIIKVWDWLVRIGHWLMVIFFAIIYLRYRKFPLHAYAGYIMLAIVVVRIAWGVVGTKAARFRSFLFSPREMFNYALQAVRGHAGYYISHNPMGSWMVYFLLAIMLVNGTLGLMLYSSGQELGPLGANVPYAWEDTLLVLHKSLGHTAAAFIMLHIIGVVWAAKAHRENYVLAMLTGYKRVPRSLDRLQTDGYATAPENVIPERLRPMERWLSYQRPFVGSLLLIIAVVLVVQELIFVAEAINAYLPYW
jgi:cytochrome b